MNLSDPVFIGGCSRSGTTLLGAMLGSPENLLVTPESQFKTDIISCFYDTSNQEYMLGEQLRNNHRLKLWGVHDKLDFENINSMTKYHEVMEYILTIYSKEKENSPEYDRWVDHTPSNLMYIERLLTYHPEAQFIHILRDPRAVVSSLLNIDWGVIDVQRASHYWLRNLTNCLVAEQMYPNKVLRIKYETLLSKPEKTIKDICAFLKIDYHIKMLSGKGFRVPNYTQKQHALIGLKPDVSIAAKWKNLLSSRQIEQVESIVGDLLYLLNYTPHYRYIAKPITKIELEKIKIARVIYNLPNRFKKWLRRRTID